eukprot:3266254-Alexandrium_andersonii.AAC.2
MPGGPTLCLKEGPAVRLAEGVAVVVTQQHILVAEPALDALLALRLRLRAPAVDQQLPYGLVDLLLTHIVL